MNIKALTNKELNMMIAKGLGYQTVHREDLGGNRSKEGWFVRTKHKRTLSSTWCSPMPRDKTLKTTSAREWYLYDWCVNEEDAFKLMVSNDISLIRNPLGSEFKWTAQKRFLNGRGLYKQILERPKLDSYCQITRGVLNVSLHGNDACRAIGECFAVLLGLNDPTLPPRNLGVTNRNRTNVVDSTKI